MKDLEKFLCEFKNKEKEIPYSFTNVIRNFSPKSKESRNWIMKRNKIKKSIIVATSLFLGSGIAFAATKSYDKIWKEPETYEFSYEVTEEEKNTAITEEEAKKKASEYLTKVGLDDGITNLSIDKQWFDNNEIVWKIGFGRGEMIISSEGEFESVNIPSYNYKIPYNYGITREEARKTAKELLAKYNPNDNDGEYELLQLRRNLETDTDSYIWYATFYKKYDNMINLYESIHIGWIPTINGLYRLDFENSKYENNEQVISKEEAIKIATEKDKQIETKQSIIFTEAEIGIDKMNTQVTYREKDIESYNKGTINFIPNGDGTATLKDDAVFYKVDNHVRKVWEVTVYYGNDKNTSDRFVYYVDATTGEIIGGDRWSGSNAKIRNLKNDQYNLIEK